MKRTIFAALILAVCFSTGSGYAGETQSAFDATCRITTSDGLPGTGIVIGDRDGRVFILTNSHVVALPGNWQGEVRPGYLRDMTPESTVKVEFWKDGVQSKPVTARVERRSVQDGRDVAIVSVPISVFGGHLPTAYPIDFDYQPRGGEIVLSAGCAEGRWPTMFRGRIVGQSDKGIHIEPSPLGGRSGSALMDASGSKIIGLIYGRTDDMGYAVPTRAIAEALGTTPHIIATQYCGPGGCPTPQPQRGGLVDVEFPSGNNRNFLGRQDITNNIYPQLPTPQVNNQAPPAVQYDNSTDAAVRAELKVLADRVTALEQYAANATAVVNDLGPKVEEQITGKVTNQIDAKIQGLADGAIESAKTGILTTVWNWILGLGSVWTVGGGVVLFFIGRWAYGKWIYPMLDALDGVKGDGVNIMRTLDILQERVRFAMDRRDGRIDQDYDAYGPAIEALRRQREADAAAKAEADKPNK